MDATIRNARASDIPALRHIWTDAFGSIEDSVFFDRYFDPDMCLAVVRGDEPVAAGYLIPDGNLTVGELRLPCAMIYAVAVLPEYRNNGYGSALTRELISHGTRSGYPAIVLCPSEDSLFEYYSTRTSLRDWFYIYEQRFDGTQIGSIPSHSPCANNAASLATSAPLVGDAVLCVPQPSHMQNIQTNGNKTPHLTQLTPDEYAALRESLLTGTPHVEMNIASITYQTQLCQQLGGGLYRINLPGGPACATIEIQPNGSVWIKELLTPDNDNTAAALPYIASIFPSAEYIIKTPTRNSPTHPCTRRFGMLAISPDASDTAMTMCQHTPTPTSNTPRPWLGLAFD